MAFLNCILIWGHWDPLNWCHLLSREDFNTKTALKKWQLVRTGSQRDLQDIMGTTWRLIVHPVSVCLFVDVFRSRVGHQRATELGPDTLGNSITISIVHKCNSLLLHFSILVQNHSLDESPHIELSFFTPQYTGCSRDDSRESCSHPRNTGTFPKYVFDRVPQ